MRQSNNTTKVFSHFVNLALKELIISRNPRNRNLLQCKCKTNVWHLICEHALAAALNLWITFDYLVEVKKKISTSRKSKGFTKAVNMNPSYFWKATICSCFCFIKDSKRVFHQWLSDIRRRYLAKHLSPDWFYQTPNRYHQVIHLLVNHSLYRQASSRFLTIPVFWPKAVHRFGALGFHRTLMKLSCCLIMFLSVMAAIANF